MAIPDQIDAQVEQEIASVGSGDYLRPGRSYNDFLNEFSGLLAQVEEDKPAITGAGFPWKKMPTLLRFRPKAWSDTVSRRLV